MMSFFGENTFFWQGVVEDRNDPKKLGRVRVRIIGLHSDDISDSALPTKSLPWAQTLQTNAAMNGINTSVSGYVEGTWVMGLSRDGRLCQDLVVLGALAGNPVNASNLNKGFNDHKNTLDIHARPKRKNDAVEHYPKTAYLNESDVNRLARNEKISSTIVADKKNSITKNELFSEPVTPYNAIYPYNDVQESESGHIKEVDDTPGAERLHEYHRSGTFREIHANGDTVTKIVGNNYKIVLQGNNVHVSGSSNLVVQGSSTIVINSNANIHVKGNSTHTTDGNVTINANSGTTHSGDIQVNGNINVSGDVVASGKSLVNHTHTGNLGFPTSSPN